MVLPLRPSATLVHPALMEPPEELVPGVRKWRWTLYPLVFLHTVVAIAFLCSAYIPPSLLHFWALATGVFALRSCMPARFWMFALATGMAGAESLAQLTMIRLLVRAHQPLPWSITWRATLQQFALAVGVGVAIGETLIALRVASLLSSAVSRSLISPLEATRLAAPPSGFFMPLAVEAAEAQLQQQQQPAVAPVLNSPQPFQSTAHRIVV